MNNQKSLETKNLYTLSKTTPENLIQRNLSNGRRNLDDKDFEYSIKYILNHLKNKIEADLNRNENDKKQKVKIKKNQQNFIKNTHEDVYEQSMKTLIQFIAKNRLDKRQSKLVFKLIMVDKEYVTHSTKYSIFQHLKLKEVFDDSSLSNLISLMNPFFSNRTTISEAFMFKSLDWIERSFDNLNKAVLSAHYSFFFKFLEYLNLGKPVAKFLSKITKLSDCQPKRLLWLKNCCTQTKFYHLKPLLEIFQYSQSKASGWTSTDDFNNISYFSDQIPHIKFPKLIADLIMPNNNNNKNNKNKNKNNKNNNNNNRIIPYGFHHLSLLGHGSVQIQRLKNWVFNSLPLLSSKSKDKNSLGLFNQLLKALIRLTDFTLEGFPEVDTFLVNFLRGWNGDKNRTEILKLFSRINMCSFGNLFNNFLYPLQNLFEFKDFQFRINLLRSYNDLLLHWLSTDWMRCWSRFPKKKPLFNIKCIHVQYYSTIKMFIKYFHTFASLALIKTNDHPIAQYWILQFYTNCSVIVTRYQLPFTIAPPVTIFNKLAFLSITSIPMNWIASILLNFHSEHLKIQHLLKINRNIPVREFKLSKKKNFKSHHQILIQFSNFFEKVLKNQWSENANSMALTTNFNNFNNYFNNNNDNNNNNNNNNNNTFNILKEPKTINDKIRRYQNLSIVRSIAFIFFSNSFQFENNSVDITKYIEYLNELGFKDLYKFITNPE
ncbi:hypothetical protein ACTFIY_009701 [Dictyostelium cf. discoideum]